MAVNRRALWLGGILIVAIVGAMVVRSTSDDATTGSPVSTQNAARNRDAARRDATSAVVRQPPVDVNLEILARDRGEPRDLGRNPFTFRPKPAPVPVAPPPVRPSDRTVDSAAPPMVPAGPPPPPPITLKFIGIVEKADGTRFAVLSDGKRPLQGREGDEIDGRYKILKIGLESLEISYIDGRGRQTIRLTGQ